MESAWKTGCEANTCVRVLDDENLADVYIGTTENPEVIKVTRPEWEQFKQAVKDGKFD